MNPTTPPPHTRQPEDRVRGSNESYEASYESYESPPPRQPEDSSAWFYHRWLLAQLQACEVAADSELAASEP